MSLFTDASLVYVPSGVKDGKTYSIVPTDGSGDLTFSRGSDIEATRISADGLIHKAQVNLLLQSNTFSTTWATTSATVTSGQAGYDGTNDAWLLEKFTATGRVTQSVSLSGLYSISVYAKKGTLDGLRIRFDGTTIDGDVYFDLASGTIGNNASSIDAQIQSVGGGWYRCSLSQNDAFTLVRFYPSDASTLSSSTGTIYIQDAQLNYGLVAQTYQETTTAAVVSGITDNMPRLNYDPANPTCPSLLLEPSRTNEVAFSEYLNAGIWIQSATSVTDNDATSPEGVTNAAKIAGDGTDTQIRLYDNYTFPSTGNYVLSVFAKAGNNDFIALAYKGVDGGITAYYDLSEGTTSDSTNGTIEAVGTDGWYRCSLKADLTGPDLTGNYNIYVAKDLTTTTFPSNGDANGQYVHAYGFQVEAGSYPTSYIPTYGSSATRNKDYNVLSSASSIIGQAEGTVFAEFNIDRNIDGTARIITISNGTSSERIGISLSTSIIYGFIVDGGLGQADIQLSTSPSGNYKVALAYANNDVVFYVNGVQIGTDTTATMPTTNEVELGNQFGASELGGGIKQALLFKTRLSNADLATLTSL